MIDSLLMECMIKNITERIIEQEIIYNKMDDPDVQELIRKRIISLEVERDSYLRILKTYKI
jgi:hypothetical protein